MNPFNFLFITFCLSLLAVAVSAALQIINRW